MFQKMSSNKPQTNKQTNLIAQELGFSDPKIGS